MSRQLSVRRPFLPDENNRAKCTPGDRKEARQALGREGCQGAGALDTGLAGEPSAGGI